ncbi:hypothetical protein PG991_009596 [Apiospora marii]|uniref:Hypervirulence associated protein TUDOR domain-containing protein n=1 Tax=Apiospora marii TaxID=335849 RepID=A0ABR1RKI9_9PEZI
MVGGKKPEKGDEGKTSTRISQSTTADLLATVSWNWGGGAPGGTVAETKTEGEIAIKSKRGNTIKKKADPENPAVHVERSGNDVVKRASELTVEKKGKSNSEEGKETQGNKRKADKEKPENEEQHDEEDRTDEPHTKNRQGKEVKKGGKAANKKQKTEQETGNEQENAGSDTDKEEETGHSEDEASAGEDTDDDQEKPATTPKKTTNDKKSGAKGKKDSAGQPKKSAPKANEKTKRDPAPRKQGHLVSTRTRSQGSK